MSALRNLRRRLRQKTLRLRQLSLRLAPRRPHPGPRRIFLHVGPHKTGTTTAQATFRMNRRRLAPHLHVVSRHHPALEALCHLTRAAQRIADLDTLATPITAAATRLGHSLAHHPTVLISHEDLLGPRPTLGRTRGLYRVVPHTLPSIVTALEDTGAKVTVLFTLRPYANWLASLQREVGPRRPRHQDKSPRQYAAAFRFPKAGWKPLLTAMQDRLGPRLVQLDMADDIATQRMGAGVLRRAGVPEDTLDQLIWSAPRRVTRPLNAPTSSG